MSIRSSVVADKPSSLNFRRTPLSIRTLGKRRPLARPAIERVRSEFAEMRGFSPTLAQAARLFDLTPDECDRVFRTLISDGSITRCEDGRYRVACA